MPWVFTIYHWQSPAKHNRLSAKSRKIAGYSVFPLFNLVFSCLSIQCKFATRSSIAAPSPSFPTPMRAKPRSPKNSCCSQVRFCKRVRSRVKKVVNSLPRIGWRLRNNAAFRSRPRSCSLNTKSTWSICSIPPVTKISLRTPTAC